MALNAVPRDALLLVLDFLAPCVGSVVAVNASMWARFCKDPLVWRRAVDVLIKSTEGRQVLQGVSSALLGRCPSLNVIVPLRLPVETCQFFDLSPSVATIALVLQDEIVIRSLNDDKFDTVATWADKKVQAQEFLSFSHDGRFLALATIHGIEILDCGTWQVVMRCSNGLAWNRLTFLCDDSLVTCTDFKSSDPSCNLGIWNIPRGGGLSVLSAMEINIKTLVSSPCRAEFAVGCKAGTLQLRSVKGKTLVNYVGHSRSVTDIAFTPDGDRLISTSWDQTAIVWKTSTGACLHVFLASVEQASFMSVDCRHGLIALGSWDNKVTIYSDEENLPQVAQFIIESPWFLSFAPAPSSTGNLALYCNSEETILRVQVTPSSLRECSRPAAMLWQIG